MPILLAGTSIQQVGIGYTSSMFIAGNMSKRQDGGPYAPRFHVSLKLLELLRIQLASYMWHKAIFACDVFPNIYFPLYRADVAHLRFDNF